MNINSTIEFYSQKGGFDHVMKAFNEEKSKLPKEVLDAFEDITCAHSNFPSCPTSFGNIKC